MSHTAFSALALHPELLSNLSLLGYETMTPIQAQSLPEIIAGRDVIGQAKTGSGKTAAFGLGVLQKLDVKRFRIQSLILCPTRELADQVAQEIRKLGRGIHNIKVLTLCGGAPFGPQLGSLEHGAHIVVGTPGRIEEHVIKGSLRLEDVTTLVLDEADRMLEMGFQPALEAIMAHLPAQRQTLLFSATFPKPIQLIAQEMMNNPVSVQVAEVHDAQSIRQHFFQVGDDEESRMTALRLLLLQHTPESAIVFCNTKRETQEVAEQLNAFGFCAQALHGDLEQRDRDQTLVRFANKSATILVATDVAARGLDIAALDLVINYQISRDLDVHIHRVGRTGRAGSQGMACTLFSDKEQYKFELLQTHLAQSISVDPLPSSRLLNTVPARSAMLTLQIDGGKKQKIRAGDILGALTSANGIQGSEVGKINVFDNWSFVAVKREAVKVALAKLSNDPIKGRSCRARVI